MTLEEWRIKEDRSMLWIAKQLGYKSASTVHNWINKSTINLKQIEAVHKLTGGKVKFKDWVGE